MSPRLILLLILPALTLTAVFGVDEPARPYADSPEIVAKLKAMGEGESLVLPPAVHMADGKPIKAEGRQGPYARDYTTRMVYAPERQTAVYAGGNHGAGRTCDVWEYHLAYDPTHTVFVMQSAYTGSMWVYRHKKAGQ